MMATMRCFISDDLEKKMKIKTAGSVNETGGNFGRGKDIGSWKGQVNDEAGQNKETKQNNANWKMFEV